MNRIGPNSSRAEIISAQIYHAREMFAQGKQRYIVKKTLMDEYGISNAVALKRMNAALSMIVEEIEEIDRKELAAILISSAQKCLEKSFDSKQYSNVLGSINLLAKIAGIITKDN